MKQLLNEIAERIEDKSIEELYAMDSQLYEIESEEYEALKTATQIAEEAFLNTLNSDQQELFDKFMDAVISQEGVEEINLYKKAFSRGVSIIIEALCMNEK